MDRMGKYIDTVVRGVINGLAWSIVVYAAMSGFFNWGDGAVAVIRAEIRQFACRADGRQPSDEDQVTTPPNIEMTGVRLR